jgi:hypothetical protein
MSHMTEHLGPDLLGAAFAVFFFMFTMFVPQMLSPSQDPKCKQTDNDRIMRLLSEMTDEDGITDWDAFERRVERRVRP